jgi:drug/metabolite transporter (DMT)-like permease
MPALTTLPALLAVLSAALWGTGDFLAGILSRHVNSFTVVFAGQCAALLAVGTLTLATHPPFGTDLLDGIVAGVLGTTALVCFYGAMAHSPMSVIAPITATGIAIPVIWDLAHGTPTSPLQGAGMLLAVIGVISAGGPELRRSPGTARIPLLFALIAAVCFGVYYIFVAQGSRGSVLGTLLGMRATGVILLAYPALRGGPGTLSGLRASLSTPLLILLPLAGLAEVSANGVYGLATSRPGANLAVVTILVALYPMMTTLLARCLLKERLSTMQNVGVIAALAGVLLLNA